jgi:hypothetical protein
VAIERNIQEEEEEEEGVFLCVSFFCGKKKE